MIEPVKTSHRTKIPIFQSPRVLDDSKTALHASELSRQPFIWAMRDAGCPMPPNQRRTHLLCQDMDLHYNRVVNDTRGPAHETRMAVETTKGARKPSIGPICCQAMMIRERTVRRLRRLKMRAFGSLGGMPVQHRGPNRDRRVTQITQIGSDGQRDCMRMGCLIQRPDLCYETGVYTMDHRLAIRQLP